MRNSKFATEAKAATPAWPSVELGMELAALLGVKSVAELEKEPLRRHRAAVSR